MNNFIKHFACFCLLLLSLAGSASKIPVGEESRFLNTISVDQYFDVNDHLRNSLTSPTSGWQDGYQFNSVQGKISLEVSNNLGICPPSSFTCLVNIKAEYAGEDNTVKVDTFTLSVDYNAKTGFSYKEKDFKVLTERAHFMKITLKGVFISDNNALGFVYIKGEIEEDRQKLAMDITNPPAFTLTKDTEKNIIKVSITPTTALIGHAEEYDLEWTFIEKDDASAVTGSTVKFDFKNNATRVTIKGSEYQMSNVFEAGYLVFRLRIAGYYKEQVGGIECIRRVTGAWSNINTGATPPTVDNGLISNNSSSTITISDPSYPPHEMGLNWQYSVSFAEEGKKSETVIYFDGILKQRQTVVKNENDHTAIVQEIIYDYEGRPAVTTLPVPVKPGLLNFYANFNRNESGLPYSAIDFDVNASNSCLAATLPMQNSSGSEKYYSTENQFTSTALSTANFPNAHNYVPLANGYPFVQVEYMNDNSGRVRAQSAPGSEYVIGGNQTHETIYFYDKPGENDLFALFGAEAGDRNHYQKQTVLDANGQGSVSYLNMSGKVIATALVGNDPNNPNGILREENIIGEDDVPTIVNGAIILNTPINITHAGYQKFKYEVTPQKYFPPTCHVGTGSELCYDCIYDLNISLKNMCGKEQFNGEGPSSAVTLITRQIGGDPNSQPHSCTEPVVYNFELDGKLSTYMDGDGYLMVYLEPGTYTLTKSLTVRQSVVESYVKDYMATQQCKTLEDYERDAWNKIDTLGCDLTCEECTYELTKEQYATRSGFIAFKQAQLVAAGVDVGDITEAMQNQWGELYDEIKNRCADLCGKIDPCATYRGMLVADITPGGQYASYTFTSAGDGTISPAIRTSTSPAATSPNIFGDVTGNPMSYKNVFNSTENIIINGLETQIISLSPTQFLEQWEAHEAEWIERFLPFHPEYCELQWCVATEASRAYDLAMMSIENYDDAVAKGYLMTSYEMDPYTLLNNMGTSGPLGIIAPVTVTAISRNYKDPLFNTANTVFIDPSSTAFNNFWTELWNYKTNGSTTVSAWDLPVIETFCGEIDPTNTSAMYSCISSHRSNMLSCKPYKNFYWHTIRALYISEKNKLLNTLKTTTYPHSECNPVIVPEIAERRFTTSAELTALSTQTETDVETAFENQCAEQCEAYKPIWREALLGCLTTGNGIEGITTVGHEGLTREEILEDILNDMVEVCKRGCNKDNPFGSSTVSPENYDVTKQNSFEEVLKSTHDYIGPTQATVYMANYVRGVCDDILIKMPQPYGHDYLATDNPVTNKCACDNGLAATDPNCPCNLSASAAVNAITMQMRNDVTDDKKCKNCIDCPTFAAFYKTFLDDYGPFNEHVYAQQQLLVNYMNQKTGFNLFFNDYRDHVMKCIGLPDAFISPFAQFKREHIDPVTIPEGLNNELPENLSLLNSSNENPLPYATKLVSDCEGFLEEVNSFMATTPTFYLHTNVPANDINIYNWITYHEGTGHLGTMMSQLSSAFSVTFSKQTLIDQFKVCLPLDCQEFESRWHRYNNDHIEVIRRNILGEPYYTDQLADDIVDFNNKIKLEVATDNLWTVDLNPSPEQNYPWYAVVPTFTPQTVVKYTDMCRKYCCGGAQDIAGDYNSETFPNLDSEIEHPTKLDLMLSVFLKPVGGVPLITNTGDISISTSAPELIPLLAYDYKYPQTVTYKQTGSSSNIVQGIITGMMAPTFSVKMQTVLLYSERFQVPSNPLAVPGTKSSYRPIQPPSDFDFTKIEGFKFISSASYNYTDIQYIYRVKYRPAPSADLKVQYVLITVSTYAFLKDITYIEPGCFPEHKLCNKPLFEVIIPTESECKRQLRIVAKTNALKNWKEQLSIIENNFREGYLAKCLEAAGTERLERKYKIYEHHYTLYYYDQAQNLVKTVPPAGVRMRTDFAASKAALKTNVFATRDNNETHKKGTVYAYNTLNQLIWQKTPDAGISQFFYDEVGRLTISQNAEQAARGTATSKAIASYTLYDGLGRIKEVGEMQSINGIVNEGQIVYPYNDLLSWMSNASNGTTSQVTKTFYDDPTSLGLSVDYHLYNNRNRVVKVAYHALGASGIQNQAVYYSYDVVGNVKQLIRQMNSLKKEYFDEEYKTVDYEYDVISGKVNRVVYQADQPDQYIHTYYYDKVNRLSEVASGYRTEAMDKDATYQYYYHGPLARVTLGSQNVQGMDYVYTLQGWLKGVNSGGLQTRHDVGKDGYIPVDAGLENIHQLIPKDEFGFILQYYTGDYAASGGSVYHNFAPTTTSSVLTNTSNNLYNGNIKMMTTAIQKFMPDDKPLAAAYSYDILNRITSASYFDNYSSTENKWLSTGTAVPDYYNTFEYDADGNIKHQLRHGESDQGIDMDDLNYVYESDENNRLVKVTDAVSSLAYLDDVKTQSGTNYEYDAIGNLVKDVAEEIAKIEWTVYGKIKRIIRTEGSLKPDLEFEYTPDGHRSVKIIIPKTANSLRLYTYYVRDAQGNVLATYSRTFNKVIDYESLTYAEVNAKLITTAGQAGFADFVAALHLTQTLPNNTMMADVNTSMKTLSATDKETFLKNNIDYTKLFIGGVSDDLLRYYIANYDVNELKQGFKDHAQEYNQREELLIGKGGDLFNCYYNGSNATSTYNNFLSTIFYSPEGADAFMRYMYVIDDNYYQQFASSIGAYVSGDLEATVAAMLTGFNATTYQQQAFYTKQSVGYNSIDNKEFLYQYSSFDDSRKAAFAVMMAQYFQNFVRLNQASVMGDPAVVGCMLTGPEELLINAVFTQPGNGQGWNTLLNINYANYVDPLDPSTPPTRDENYYLDFCKNQLGYEYLYDIGNGAYPSYITTSQQAHNQYSTAGNGIQKYLEYFKQINGQQAYDAVTGYFYNNSTAYIDEIYLKEHTLYGSSRLGIRKTSKRMGYGIYNSTVITDGQPIPDGDGRNTLDLTNIATDPRFVFVRGEKKYELSNHLGNVMVVVTDKRIPKCTYFERTMDNGEVSAMSVDGATAIIENNKYKVTPTATDGGVTVKLPVDMGTYLFKFDIDMGSTTGGNGLMAKAYIWDDVSQVASGEVTQSISGGGSKTISYTVSAPLGSGQQVMLKVYYSGSVTTPYHYFSVDNIQATSTTGGLVAFAADVMQATDYSPFGAPLANRSWNTGTILYDQFKGSNTGSWQVVNGGATLDANSGNLTITAPGTATVQRQAATEAGKQYNVLLDANAGSFTNIKIEVRNGSTLIKTYTTVQNGNQIVGFTATGSETTIRLIPQGATGSSKTCYVAYVKLVKASAENFVKNTTAPQNLTVTSRSSGAPQQYIATETVTFENEFESLTNDEFETTLDQMVLVNNGGGEDDEYRFGFNGMERDDEVSGAGNSYSTEYRQYDPRLGRWMSIDPQYTNFPWQSPYAAFDNNPIIIKDPKGLAGEKANGGGNDPKVKEKSAAKFDKKIATPLRELDAKLRSEGADEEDVRDQVQQEANRLATKYQNKNWLHVASGLGSAQKSDGVGGGKVKNTVSIVAYPTPPVQNLQVDNRRPNDNIVNTGNTGLIVQPGGTVTVRLNPYSVANSVSVQTTDGSGNSTQITTSGMQVGANRENNYVYSNTTTISTTNAGQVSYSVQNSVPDATFDKWQLNIQVQNPSVINPVPLITNIE